MTLTQLIPLAISVSMGLLLFALALRASLDDALYLIRRPGLMVRSLLSMAIIMPLLAAALVAIFDLHPAIEIAIIAMAFSPVPPILPGKQEKAGGTESYVIDLLFTAAVLAIFVVPIGIHVAGRIFGLSADVPFAAVVPPVLITIIVPLVLGIGARKMVPDLGEWLAKPVSLFAFGVLIIACVPVLIGSWPLLVSMIGNGTLLVLALFTAVGLAVGHFLGGPDPDNRSVLALATGTRHPGVALAIADATFPDEKAVLAVVLLHLVVGAIVSIPYVRWRKRAHAAESLGGRP